jgi:hypothetical protein
MSYGHALKTVGRLEDGIAAYRRALAARADARRGLVEPRQSEDGPVRDADVAAMERRSPGRGLGRDDRFHLHFALGKAHEDRGEPSRLRHYAEGNRLRAR